MHYAIVAIVLLLNYVYMQSARAISIINHTLSSTIRE